MSPSEGEEFGYVLSGAVYLVLKRRSVRLRTGWSFSSTLPLNIICKRR